MFANMLPLFRSGRSRPKRRSHQTNNSKIRPTTLQCLLRIFLLAGFIASAAAASGAGDGAALVDKLNTLVQRIFEADEIKNRPGRKGRLWGNGFGYMKMILQEEAEEAIKPEGKIEGLTDSEVVVIKYYKQECHPDGGFYTLLNTALRSRNKFSRPSPPLSENAVRLFDPYRKLLIEALTKLGVKKYDVVYRGMRGDDNPYANFKVGETITHNDFLSTSKEEDLADQFSGFPQKPDIKLIIRDVLGVELDKLYKRSEGFIGEKEVLIIPNSTFAVTDMKFNDPGTLEPCWKCCEEDSAGAVTPGILSDGTQCSRCGGKGEAPAYKHVVELRMLRPRDPTEEPKAQKTEEPTSSSSSSSSSSDSSRKTEEPKTRKTEKEAQETGERQSSPGFLSSRGSRDKVWIVLLAVLFLGVILALVLHYSKASGLVCRSDDDAQLDVEDE